MGVKEEGEILQVLQLMPGNKIVTMLKDGGSGIMKTQDGTTTKNILHLSTCLLKHRDENNETVIYLLALFKSYSG